MASLTGSEEDDAALATHLEPTPTSGTRAGKDYLKKYPDMAEDVPVQPLDKPKQKELWYNKALRKDTLESSSSPFKFDVMAQLANIPARITLYELLRLSPATRESLCEALADAEAFLTHLPPPSMTKEGEECPQCCQTSIRKIPCITFTPEDMFIKNTKHDRPLYFTGYIGSAQVDRIQVDPGSA